MRRLGQCEVSAVHAMPCVSESPGALLIVILGYDEISCPSIAAPYLTRSDLRVLAAVECRNQYFVSVVLGKRCGRVRAGRELK